MDYVEPDISVICDLSKYWIVDPDKKMVMVYGFEKDMVEQYLFGEDIPVGTYEGFSIKIE